MPYASISTNNETLITYKDLDKACEEIARFNTRDAATYRRFAERAMKMLPMFLSGLYAPPIPFGPFMAMLDAFDDAREILDSKNRKFEDNRVKIHLLKLVPENLQLPDENGTGMGIFIMPGIIHACGVSQPVGGSGGLTYALVRCFEDLGGELLLNAKVGKVLVEGGVAVGLRRAGGAEMRGSDGVIAALHPHVLSCFVAGIDPEVDRRAKAVTLPTQSLPTLAQIVLHYDLRLRTKYRAGAEITTATMLGYFPFTDLASLLDDFDYLRRKRILPRRLLTWPKVISPQIMVARARQLPP